MLIKKIQDIWTNFLKSFLKEFLEQYKITYTKMTRFSLYIIGHFYPFSKKVEESTYVQKAWISFPETNFKNCTMKCCCFYPDFKEGEKTLSDDFLSLKYILK